MKFTGRQMTAMVVAGCAALVLMPVGVNAAVSSFSIADPTHTGSGRKAAVSGGALRVAGNVNTQPTTAWTKSSNMLDSGDPSVSGILVIKELNAGASVRIGTIAANIYGGADGMELNLITKIPDTPGQCTGSGLVVGYPAGLTVPPYDSRSVNFTPMLTVKNTTSGRLCVILYPTADSGFTSATVTITGS